MALKIDRVEQIKVSVTDDGVIAIEQQDALGNEPATIHVSKLQLTELVKGLLSAGLEADLKTTSHRRGTCERCGEHEPRGALRLVWSMGMAGQDIDAFGAEVCDRCAPQFIELWDAIALANTTDEELSPAPTSAQKI